jgi:hypothetical protein
MMMETFEIKRENDGTILGKYKARPEGKLVSEVLENLKKKGLDGTLLEKKGPDDTTIILTNSDLLTPGCIYKFWPSIHVPSPGSVNKF